jgi:hypothetical protein
MSRAYSTYSVRELYERKDINPKFLSDMTDRQKESLTRSIQFLMAAAKTRPKIAHLSIYKAFIENDAYQDEENLRAALFEIAEAGFPEDFMASEYTVTADLNGELHPELIRAATSSSTTRDSLIRQRDTARQGVEAASATFNTALAALARNNELLEKFSPESTDAAIKRTIDGINQVHKDGLWQFLGVSGGNLCFITANRVTMTYFVTGSRPDTCDAGHWLLYLNPSTKRIRLRSLTVESIYHPHVTTSGEVCWGDHKAIIPELLMTFDIVQLSRLAHSLLSTFGGTPYVSFGDFKMVNKTTMLNQALLLDQNTDFAWTYRVKEMADIIISKLQERNATREDLLTRLVASKCIIKSEGSSGN